MEKERILCVEKRFLLDSIQEGFAPIELDAVLPIIEVNKQFVDREDAEVDQKLWQIIPYVVLLKEGQVFLTRRTKKQSEKRLHNKYSIGLGGHINLEDNFGLGARKIIFNAIWRELNEEMYIEPQDKTSGAQNELKVFFLGVINDSSNEVSSVHLGLVFALDCTNLVVSIREKDKMSGQWESLSYLDEPSISSALESWSALVIKQIKQSKQ